MENNTKSLISNIHGITKLSSVFLAASLILPLGYVGEFKLKYMIIALSPQFDCFIPAVLLFVALIVNAVVRRKGSDKAKAICAFITLLLAFMVKGAFDAERGGLWIFSSMVKKFIGYYILQIGILLAAVHALICLAALLLELKAVTFPH